MSPFVLLCLVASGYALDDESVLLQTGVEQFPSERLKNTERSDEPTELRRPEYGATNDFVKKVPNSGAQYPYNYGDNYAWPQAQQESQQEHLKAQKDKASQEIKRATDGLIAQSVYYTHNLKPTQPPASPFHTDGHPYLIRADDSLQAQPARWGYDQTGAKPVGYEQFFGKASTTEQEQDLNGQEETAEDKALEPIRVQLNDLEAELTRLEVVKQDDQSKWTWQEKNANKHQRKLVREQIKSKNDQIKDQYAKMQRAWGVAKMSKMHVVMPSYEAPKVKYVLPTTEQRYIMEKERTDKLRADESDAWEAFRKRSEAKNDATTRFMGDMRKKMSHEQFGDTDDDSKETKRLNQWFSTSTKSLKKLYDTLNLSPEEHEANMPEYNNEIAGEFVMPTGMNRDDNRWNSADMAQAKYNARENWEAGHFYENLEGNGFAQQHGHGSGKQNDAWATNSYYQDHGNHEVDDSAWDGRERVANHKIVSPPADYRVDMGRFAEESADDIRERGQHDNENTFQAKEILSMEVTRGHAGEKKSEFDEAEDAN